MTPALLQPEEPVPDDVARLRVEPGRGLVEQQHLRVVHERPGDRQPSLHPARQRLDLVVGAFAQLDEIDELVRPPAEVAPGQAEVAAVDDDVLADRQLHVQRVLLRHDAEPRADVRALRHRIQAEDAQRSRRRRRDAPDHSHRRRLPAPFGPRKPKASPRCTSKSTPSTAASPPKRLISPRACTNGSAAPASTTPSTYRRQRARAR